MRLTGHLGKGLDISDCDVGINFATSNFPGGSLTVMDSQFDNVQTGILVDTQPVNSEEQVTVVLLNTAYTNTRTLVDSKSSGAYLNGGSNGYVESYFVGKTYSEGSSKNGFSNSETGDATGIHYSIPQELRFAFEKTAGVYSRSRPQYLDENNWMVVEAAGKRILFLGYCPT